jgi:hypothetical protein
MEDERPMADSSRVEMRTCQPKTTRRSRVTSLTPSSTGCSDCSQDTPNRAMAFEIAMRRLSAKALVEST